MLRLASAIFVAALRIRHGPVGQTCTDMGLLRLRAACIGSAPGCHPTTAGGIDARTNLV